MMKKFILPAFGFSLVFLFSSCVRSSSNTFSADQTVMLHWLDLDDGGLVRMADNEGNASSSSKIFTGKAIETFEQSPTKSVSGWRDGKRHGATVEYFYNGRKRRVIRFGDGVRDGVSEEYRITGELLRKETYSKNVLDGPKSDWHPNGTKIFEVSMRNGKPHGEALEWFARQHQKIIHFLSSRTS